MLLLAVKPTAQASEPDRAATAVSPSPPLDGVGLGRRCHCLPFQCQTKVSSPEISPTAQALEADRAVTPCRGTEPAARSRSGTSDQARPSQRSTRVLWPATPTAQALRAETAATASSLPGRNKPAGAARTGRDDGTAAAGTAAAGRDAAAGFTGEHPAVTDATGSMMAASAPAPRTANCGQRTMPPLPEPCTTRQHPALTTGAGRTWAAWPGPDPAWSSRGPKTRRLHG